MIDIYTPSGIGDIYWLLSKVYYPIERMGEKIRIHTPPGQDEKASRGKFLEYMSAIESVKPDGITYNELKQKAKNYYTIEKTMYLECNSWLESGKSLESYLPKFKSEYNLPWPIVCPPEKTKKRVVVYTSGKQNNNSKSTGRWSYTDWRILCHKLKKLNCELWWIGASYDIDMVEECKINNFWIDKDAPSVMALLRSADAFISFQSGLSCISVMEKIPTCMLYFRKLDLLSKSFHPQGGNYRPLFFDDIPIDNVITWTKEAIKE